MLATALIQISDQQIAVVILAVLPSLVEIQCSCMAHCCCENSDCRVTFFFFLYTALFIRKHTDVNFLFASVPCHSYSVLSENPTFMLIHSQFLAEIGLLH